MKIDKEEVFFITLFGIVNGLSIAFGFLLFMVIAQAIYHFA